MTNNIIEGVDIHPLIAAQEKRNETTVEFRGFLGTEDEQFIRLYTDLKMSSCVEIPNDALLHWEKDSDGTAGKIRVFVSASREVTEVFKRRIMARSSGLSLNGAKVAVDEDSLHILKPPPRLTSFWTCVGDCKAAFAALAGQIISLEAQIPLSTPTRAQQLRATVDTLKTRAKAALSFCLSQCPPIPKSAFRAIPNPDGSYTLRPISLGEIESEICVEFLGEANCGG